MEVITTHRNTDFDALASVFSAAILHPGATPILPRSLNPNVRAFLSIHKDLFPFGSPKDIEPEETSKLIVVDANSWDRLEGVDALKQRSDLDIHMWDHHQERGDIKANWSCCDPVGATTTLLTRRLEQEKEKLSTIQASLFLAGIYEDTGNLTFPSTTAQDAKAAAFLLEQKADLSMLNNFLRPVYGPKQKNVLFEMLKNSKRQKLKGYSVSLIKQKVEGHTPGLALVVDMYQDIMNVDAAFGIFTEAKKDRTIVIGRSGSASINIGAIMRSMGGGGHPNAGSAMLKSVNPDAVEKWIAELIKGNQKASVQISDLMSFPVFTVTPETTMKEVALLLREKGCTGFPVVEGETVVGIISRRDFKKVKSKQMSSPVKAFMCSKVAQIDPGSSVVQAARLMIKHDIGRLPVVENGKLIGIITRADTMRYYYDLLPDN
jgi:nanoRNase/pAp phosphatase (c-di-AMP/oligoRNAs hydrolase)/CBS domain-containing protein